MSLPETKTIKFDRLAEFKVCHWQEVAELRLREALIPFGTGIHISHRENHDTVQAFPTRRYDVNTHKGIWEIDLELRGKIGQANIVELLRDHLLTQSEFEEWNRKEWEPWLN